MFIEPKLGETSVISILLWLPLLDELRHIFGLAIIFQLQ